MDNKSLFMHLIDLACAEELGLSYEDYVRDVEAMLSKYPKRADVIVSCIIECRKVEKACFLFKELAKRC